MSRGAIAPAFSVPAPTTDPACPFCMKGPVLPSESTCPYCRANGLKVYTRCRVCSCALTRHDNYEFGACESCADRTEGKRMIAGDRKAPTPPPGDPRYTGPPQRKPDPPPAPPKKQARAFTTADKSLIKNCHAFMPAAQLLGILNERMHADVGADAPDYTLEQLHAETSTQQQSAAASDWSSLRQTITIARRCGLLHEITPQVVDDFAVVYSLSSAQHMHLRDVIRSVKEVQ